MKDKKKNGWIKFVPSLDLPKERVSIAYDTHDERGVRYAYGYFQFYNGTCGCFWKDGNEQPKVVKAEDIKYWMPVPSLDVQEEPVSEGLEAAIDTYLATYFGGEKEKQDWPFLKKMAIHFANWNKQKDGISASEDLEEAANNAVIALVPSFGQKYSDGSYVSCIRDSFKREELIKLYKAGAVWQKQKDKSKVLTEE
jgi:hypothetical protein